MKQVFTVLICFVTAILLLLALEQRFFPPPFKAEIVQTLETSNTPFRIRINMHLERGGFAPVLGGAYYDFQSAAAGSDSWHEITTLRYDDPIDIPKDQIHFANDKVAYLFMIGMYAVTTDGGASWKSYNISDYLPVNDKCSFVKDLQIDADGAGEIRIKSCGNNDLKMMGTTNFGKTWREI